MHRLHSFAFFARRTRGIAFAFAAALALAACGDGGGSVGPSSYTVGGTVSGLNGSLVLQNSGADNLTLSTNGGFSFATPITNGSAYNITVLTQPTGQTCVVASGMGTISANVTNVAVTCTTNNYTVGGTVSGLTGTVVLQNNGGNGLSVSADGNFTFATSLPHNSSYAVTVLTQPTGQTCSVSTGSGTVSANNVTNVSVTCSINSYSVGGTVSGLGAWATLVLQDNGGDNLSIPANGGFSFATPVAHGSNYTVTVLTQPNQQNCSVSNGTGTITGAVTNVTITCATNTYTVGGTVSGLNGSMVLQSNGADNLGVSTNGAFTFATALPYGSAYSVTLQSLQFPGQACTITGGTGTISASVTNVAVSCAKLATPRYALVANHNDNSISSYVVDNASGRLKYIGKSAAGTGPYSVTVDPSGKYAYAANYNGSAGNTVSQYTIGENGLLTPMAPAAVAAGTGPISIAVDPTGRYAYVTNRVSNNVSQYTVGATGALTPMTAPSVAAGAKPQSVAVDPSGRYVYVGNASGGVADTVSQYTIDATGALTPMGSPTVAAGAAPWSVVVDPTGKYVYVANQNSNNVSQYAIDATGALVPMATATVGAGSQPYSVTVDPSGKYVYVANIASNDVSQYAIGASGALTALTAPTAGAVAMPSSVTVDPSGKYAYAANNAGADISQYGIGANGALAPMAPATVAGVTNPTSITIVPGAAPVQAVPKYAYVANSGSVSQYTIDSAGALAPMGTPSVATGAASALSVAVHPSGKYAYVTNYGNMGDGTTVSQFIIGASGALTPMAAPTVATALGPISVAVDPSGKYAYVANNNGGLAGTVSQYTIGASGALTPMATATVAAGTGPASVAVDPTGRYVYVANDGNGSVSQYTIGVGGALAPMTAPTVAAGINPRFVTVDPSGKYAYVVNYNSSSVARYAIGASGALTLMSGVTVGTPGTVAVDPSGKYAYVTGTSGVSNSVVYQYTVDASGVLSPMATPSVATAEWGGAGIAVTGTWQ